MNYLIDLILVALIAISNFIGYKKGLIKVAFGLVSFVLAIIISVILYKPVSNFIINNTPLDEKIESVISEKFTSSETSDEEINNIVANYFSNVKDATAPIVVDTISKTIINISCMIIVFVVSKIILAFFKFIGDLIAKIPLIKQVNSAGGFLYGLLKGFIIVYILLALISIISPFVNINGLINMINSSIITNIMYNNNIIFILFG